MNHGATHVSMGNRGRRIYLSNAAFYFLSRGYAVASPMMRGFSTSGGALYHFGCDLAGTGLAYARDIRAVIRYLGNDPRFDTSRVIVAGQSMGGWNTLAVGALQIPNVKALVNFNGGIRVSDCKAGDSALLDGATAFGAATRIPSIWFYGDNDQLFSVPLWQAMHERYVRGGARAELVDVGTVMQDSHNFLAYPETLPVWTRRIDAFLAGIGMPYRDVNPGDLPLSFPPPTQFASVTDVAAVPYLTDKGRDKYRKFLDRPFPRVFVISPGRGVADMSGGFDPLGRALADCHSQGVKCAVYAVDDQVVWKPAPGERDFNITAKAGQTTTIDFASRLNPDCTPKAFAELKVVQPPAHGRVDIGPKDDFPKFPSNNPFAVCDKQPVHGIAVTYTPAKGFSGTDVFSFVDAGAQGPTLKISLTVK
jgi:dienelactone hydrolase